MMQLFKYLTKILNKFKTVFIDPQVFLSTTSAERGSVQKFCAASNEKLKHGKSDETQSYIKRIVWYLYPKFILILIIDNVKLFIFQKKKQLKN